MITKTGTPGASVIMPCFNHGRFVVNSVAAILRQTYSNLELIVVDDSSSDDSVAVLREMAHLDPRLKLIIHDRNLGASRSRNDGLRAARGDFIGFCDADDLWKPDKLESQIKLLVDNPAYDVTYCDSEIIDQNGIHTGELFSQQFPLPKKPSGNLFEQLSVTNFVNMQTVLVRNSALGEGIFFDENIKWVEDWWQWIRLSRKHQFLYAGRPMAQYRVHSHSTGLTQKPGIRRNRWKVCKRNLRLHPNMPVELQSRLWSMMGVELSLMDRPRLARRFFARAIWLGLKAGTPSTRLLVAGARCGIEFFRELLPARLQFKNPSITG